MIEGAIKIKKAFVLDGDGGSAKLLIAPIAATSEINVTIFKNPSGYIEVIAEEKRYEILIVLCKNSKSFWRQDSYSGFIGRVFDSLFESQKNLR